MQNLVYEWVDFLKFSNFEPKFWKNQVILLKIWPKIGPIGIWMGHFFLKNWYLYGSTFKICGGTALPKPNLSTPQGLKKLFVCYIRKKIKQDQSFCLLVHDTFLLIFLIKIDKIMGRAGFFFLWLSGYSKQTIFSFSDLTVELWITAKISPNFIYFFWENSFEVMKKYQLSFDVKPYFFNLQPQ